MSLELARNVAPLFGLDSSGVTAVAMRENLTFSALKDGHKFALRLHRPGYTPKPEILSELQWMQVLATNGFSVPAPLPTLDGNLIADHNGQIVSVLEWMPGQTMDTLLATPEANRVEAFHALGQLLAKMHNISDAWATPSGFKRRAWDAEGLLGETPVWGRFWENPHLTEEDRKTLLQLRQNLQNQLAAHSETLDYGLIHADAVSENVLYCDNNPTLIDFDDSGWGFRLFDLATPLNRERTAPDYKDVEAAMFDGYRHHRALDTTHFKLIALLRALTYLGWIIPRIDEPAGHERLVRFRKMAFRLMD